MMEARHQKACHILLQLLVSGDSDGDDADDEVPRPKASLGSSFLVKLCACLLWSPLKPCQEASPTVGGPSREADARYGDASTAEARRKGPVSKDSPQARALRDALCIGLPGSFLSQVSKRANGKPTGHPVCIFHSSTLDRGKAKPRRTGRRKLRKRSRLTGKAQQCNSFP